MNIYQKLHEIQKRIIGLGKDKKSNTYEYVTGGKVLEHIKPLMNEFGLLLKQEVLSIENDRMDYKTGIGTTYEKPKSEILSKVMMRFTWIDVATKEQDENLFGANGQNEWEKGLGSALTYAERYFLLKYFHIATDEDDIDNPERDDKKKAGAPLPPPDYKAQLETAENVASLGTIWTAIPTDLKPQYLQTKDNMKEILAEVEKLGKIKTMVALEAYIEGFNNSPLADNAKLKALIEKRKLDLKA